MFDHLTLDNVIFNDDEFLNMETFEMGLFDEGSEILYIPAGGWPETDSSQETD